MKVSDIVNRVNDVEDCRKLLAEWNSGKIKVQDQIDALAEEIDTHLEAYTELLMNKEVK